MHRRFRRALSRGWLAAFVFLLCVGSVAVAGRVHAGDDGGLLFYLYPENDSIQYACVGKKVSGWFSAEVTPREPADYSPLAPLTPPQIRVTALDPSVGTLSPRAWTLNSGQGSKTFIYTPTKPGNETLTFYAAVPNSSYPTVAKQVTFPVINCRYRVSVHSEILNVQGGIKTNIFYDGEGHFDVTSSGKAAGWTIKGYGSAKYEAYSDGTEHGMTCVTTSPGKGGGNFVVSGDGDPSSMLNVTVSFSDTGTGIGITCRDDKRSATSSIPNIGWLPSGSGDGVLSDLKFSAKGGNLDLDMPQFQDKRWVVGATSGTMLVTVLPVTGQ